MWFALTSPFWLWVFFLAVMHLRDVRDAGLLTGHVVGPAYAVLAVGYILDAFVNLLWGCVWFRELPPRQAKFPYFEPTVSHRTRRWAAKDDADDYRVSSSRYLRRVFLARFDRTGGHD